MAHTYACSLGLNHTGNRNWKKMDAQKFKESFQNAELDETEKYLSVATGKLRRLRTSEWELVAKERLKQIIEKGKESNHVASEGPQTVEHPFKPTLPSSVKISRPRPKAKKKKLQEDETAASFSGRLVDDNTSGQSSSEEDNEGLDGAVIVASQEKLFDELGLSKRERVVGRYILSLGFSDQEFIKLADKRLQAFLTNLHAAKSRVAYLQSLGVEDKNVPKVLLRHPQLLEYSIERTMKPRVDFLISLGVCKKHLGRIITLVPTLLEYRIEECLKPRVKYLRESVGIAESDLPLVLQRSPQILTQSIENSLQPKLDFLQSLGIDLEDVARMVTRHPQLLHYSVNDNMKPRIQFLRKIGMSDPDVVKTLVRLSQILSLSVESNLIPKFTYLKDFLGGDAGTVSRFPAYFSLSLEQRIKPRHQYLVSLNKLPEGPFPMKLLTINDCEFCRMVQCSEKEYFDFRNKMVLASLTKKFGKTNEKPKKKKKSSSSLPQSNV